MGLDDARYSVLDVRGQHLPAPHRHSFQGSHRVPVGDWTVRDPPSNLNVGGWM